MRDGAGPPANRVPAATRARGVTDEGLAPVRGVGTGHADCRNSPRVTQGSLRSHYSPRLAPAGSHPICYGTRGGPGRFTSPPGMRPGRGWRRCRRRTRRAGADGTLFGRPIVRGREWRAARAAGSGGPGAGRVQRPAASPPSKTQAPATLPAHTAAPTVVVTASAGKRVWPHRAVACPHAACRMEGAGGGPLGTDASALSPLVSAGSHGPVMRTRGGTMSPVCCQDCRNAVDG
jgi:hypothetical protein